MEQVTNKIVEKIEKLLSLATSANEHEAKLAMSKALELLTKYNLSMTDVKTEYYNTAYARNERGAKREDKFITGLLNRYFFVKCVYVNNMYIQIFGKKSNVKIAVYVFEFLSKKYKDLWKEYKKENAEYNPSQSSYYIGLFEGLFAQLEKIKNNVQTDTGLMVISDPKIDDFIKDLIGAIETTKGKKKIVDSETYYDGKKEGKNIKIHKGMESGPTSKEKLCLK